MQIKFIHEIAMMEKPQTPPDPRGISTSLSHLHPTPYSVYPTPHASIPYTPQRVPYTPCQHTLNPTACTLNPMSAYPTPLHPTPHSVYPTPHTSIPPRLGLGAAAIAVVAPPH